MHTDSRYKHSDITNCIIQSFYKVYNQLGYGFREKVYSNALSIELEKSGVASARECPIDVHYDGRVVGEYFADLIVENCIILEIKSVQSLAVDHEAQLLNYLKATRFEVGLLLNFGPKPQIKRKVFITTKKEICPGFKSEISVYQRKSAS